MFVKGFNCGPIAFKREIHIHRDLNTIETGFLNLSRIPPNIQTKTFVFIVFEKTSFNSFDAEHVRKV